MIAASLFNGQRMQPLWADTRASAISTRVLHNAEADGGGHRPPSEVKIPPPEGVPPGKAKPAMSGKPATARAVAAKPARAVAAKGGGAARAVAAKPATARAVAAKPAAVRASSPLRPALFANPSFLLRLHHPPHVQL